MESVLSKVLPLIILFLVMGLPFFIVVYKFDQAHIGRLKFATGSVILAATSFLNLPGLIVWLPITVYAIICGLRANDLAMTRMTKMFNVLIPLLLFFAWPYFAFAKGVVTVRKA